MSISTRDHASDVPTDERTAPAEQGSFLRFLEDVERLRASHRLATQIVRVLMARDHAEMRELLDVCAKTPVPAAVREELHLFLRLPPWTNRAPVQALLHERRVTMLLAEAVREAVAYTEEVDP